MSEWRDFRLGDALTVKHGFAFKSEYFGDAGSLIVLTPGNFHDGGGFKSKSGAEKFYEGPVPEGYVLNRGDVVVAMTEQAHGLLGSSATIPSDDTYLHNQRIGLVRVADYNALNLRFVYHLFNSAGVRTQLQATATGSKVRHTAPERIEHVRVLVPDVDTQRRIAEILDAIDDLIENNRRRIALLEQMAEAIYREWFAHFRYPGHEEDELVDSPHGPIPVNWRAVRTAQLIESSVLEIGDGYRAKNSEFSDEGVPFVRVRNVQNGTLQLAESDLLSFDYVARVAGKSSRPGDCVIATKGTVGRVAFVGEATPTVIYSPQVSYWRSLDSGTLSPAYLRRWIGSDHFRLQCAQVKGATDMADYVNLKDQRRMWMMLPERRVQAEFAAKVGPMHQLADSLSVGASVLSDLRDRLLPKLVTGQIDISTFDLDALLGESAA